MSVGDPLQHGHLAKVNPGDCFGGGEGDCLLCDISDVHIYCTLMLLSCASQSWADDDYRNARFIDRQKEVRLSFHLVDMWYMCTCVLGQWVGLVTWRGWLVCV